MRVTHLMMRKRREVRQMSTVRLKNDFDNFEFDSDIYVECRYSTSYVD